MYVQAPTTSPPPPKKKLLTNKTNMGITTSFLEYAVLAYVMAIVITGGLYLIEHYEIRYRPTGSTTTTFAEQEPMLVYESEM